MRTVEEDQQLEDPGDPEDPEGPSTSSARHGVALDHIYSNPSPSKLKRKLEIAQEDAERCRKKLKTEHQKTRRLRKKVDSLSAVVDEIQQKNLISPICAEVLETTFSGIPLHVAQRLLKKRQGKAGQHEYDPELRSFAMTLNYYSSKAYNYVRETFNLCLPHPSTLKSWYTGIDGDPGFNKQAFQSLKEKTKDGKTVLVALMIDEMAIRKNVEWDGKKLLGFVDMGTGIDDDKAPVATEVLVFMVVCVNGSWKLPVGHFFISSLTGQERANLVLDCIERLSSVKITVTSLTCDGPSCHFSMMKSLGVVLDANGMNTSFPHPSIPEERVFVILDICHMLKLVRNTLGSYGIIVDGDGRKIMWQYIEELHKLQQTEGLHLGNKLTKAHMQWESRKMKVNLASQTLSASVAAAMRLCKEELKLPQFADCDATCTFIELFDQLFDVLNSRNPLGKGFKAPMKVSNESNVIPFLDRASDYIRGLKEPTGKQMTSSKRKTAFVGFLASVQSIKQIYLKYVKSEESPLSYLLTYKFSQDHLELFFAAVRSSGGCNNNPTVKQFSTILKRLMVRHEIKCNTGNCSAQDSTSILPCLQVSKLQATVPDGTSDFAMVRRHDPELIQETTQLNDHTDEVPDLPPLSDYKTVAIGYIAGYVVLMVRKRLKCEECLAALVTDQFLPDSMAHNLIRAKDRGGLIKPSKSVIQVCDATERHFQSLVKVSGGLPRENGLINKLSSAVLSSVGSNVFNDLEDHMFDSSPENNHVFGIVKCIVGCFAKIRMHHLTKAFNSENAGKYVRKKYSKLIHFQHQ